MAVVRLEAVVRPLPEIRAAARLDAQTMPGRIHAPPVRLAVPAQLGVQSRAGERFVEVTHEHDNSPRRVLLLFLGLNLRAQLGDIGPQFLPPRALVFGQPGEAFPVADGG
jgi:hypothetical protein